MKINLHSAADASVDGIIHDLYAGTLDEAAWNRALIALADLVHASGALLLACNAQTGAVLRFENHRSRLSRTAGESAGDLPSAHWPTFRLHDSHDKVVTLSFRGARERGACAEHELENCRTLLPHLMLALEIRDRLERAEREVALARGLNRTLSIPIIVLDARGGVLEANAAAREKLRAGDGIRLRPRGLLWLREPAGAELARWIFTSGRPAKTADGLVRVPRALGPPISILVTPLPESVTSWMAGDPRWLLVVFDPDRRVRPSAELLARDLGISASEAQVAALLAAGHSLRAVASRLGKSPHTVRAQVKSIFRRTGIGGQSELIRRVLLGPAIHGTSAPVIAGPEPGTRAQPPVRRRNTPRSPLSR
jgi:DNA-binding CsgD family transcriptional regulator/PAS domain-containing protein